MKSILIFIAFVLLLVPFAQATDVALAWDASASSGVTGYKIYYGTASRAYGKTPVSVTSATAGTVTGLAAGTWYFAVTAFDGSGNESAYSVEISTTIAAPLTLTGPPTTTGTSGVAFSTAMTAAGGKAPYTFSIQSGALPAGLSLNTATGAISGTPTKAGSFSFTVKVVDSNNPVVTASQACTLTIALAPPTNLKIVSQSASSSWFWESLKVATNNKSKAVLQYGKQTDVGYPNSKTVDNKATKTSHSTTLMVRGSYKYQWLLTDASDQTVIAKGVFIR
jgi:hypothetical protein